MSSRSKRAQKKRGRGFSLTEKIIGLAIIVVVIWGVYTLVQQPAPTSSGTDFTLPAVDANGLTGQKVTLSSFAGKVVLLEFMSPKCVHCMNMAPVLEQLYQRYSPQNVVFVSVSGTFLGATLEDTTAFISQYHSTWTYVYDSSGTTFSAWGVTGTPTLFIIGKNGQIAKSYPAGEVAAETIAADLTRLNA